jgi:D-glycero-D-manno-heptose 1,7-bisphosphate phosphatase
MSIAVVRHVLHNFLIFFVGTIRSSEIFTTGNSMSVTTARGARAVFLDRDGVINANVLRNGKPVAPTSLAQFRLLPGVATAIRRLKEGGFFVIVVTNQPDVRTGLTPQETLDSIHAVLRQELLIDDIKVCPHIDADDCACRKPKPGLILDAAREYGIDLARSYLVGDRWRDTFAGRAAGCFTFFVDHKVEQEKPHGADRVVEALCQAVNYILDER